MAESSRSRLTLDLEPDLRRRLRLAAAQRDKTMTDYVRGAIELRLEADLPRAILAVDDPVLEELWDNDADAIYDGI